MSEVLAPERIRELYKAFQANGAWATWQEQFEAELRWVHDAPDTLLASKEGQERLWSLKALGTTGPSESLSVAALTTDADLARRIVGMRRQVWVADPSRRAVALQQAYNDLLATVRTKCASGSTPVARLVRILHALLPAELHCGYSAQGQVAIRDLLAGERNLGVVGSAVIARARLREALGPEADLKEHARRSTFCWWIAQGIETPNAEGTPELSPPDPTEPTHQETVRLVPWPFVRQHRWLQPVQGGLDTLRVALREAQEEVQSEAIVAALKEELQGAPAYAVPAVTRNLRRLGLLDERDGRSKTTAAGEALLEADPPDPLIEALIVRAAGFAALLRHLADHGPANSALIEAMRPYCQDKNPSNFTGFLLWWSKQAGLTGADRGLTELGRAWVERLSDDQRPPELPRSDAGSVTLWDPGASVASAEALAYPTFLDLFHTLQEDRGTFVLDREQTRAVHVAWTFHERKRFVILSGLSGTGKTQILLRIANAVCRRLGLIAERHIALVPVRPDWRDPTGLLGYFNALHAEPTFQAEPALRLALAAGRDPGRPYFLILDEMNLARVERYFAPFLSAMESGREIELHAEAGSVNGVPPSMRWPGNLRIGGTVNMDETTYPFSDKVLDRAFTVELWDVDLQALFDGRKHRSPEDGVIEALLVQLHDLLKPVRRHFGYRTAEEVLEWVSHARRQDPSASVTGLLDQAVFSKILPRLRGSESAAWARALAEVEKACDHLPRCKAKVASMRAQLGEAGVSGFWS